MPSPFPGMDPFLEGYMWADVHQALAYQLRKQLTPLVRPDYAVRLALSVYNDRVPAHELGILYADVEVIRPQSPSTPRIREGTSVATISIAPLSIPLTVATQVRQVSVEARCCT